MHRYEAIFIGNLNVLANLIANQVAANAMDDDDGIGYAQSQALNLAIRSIASDVVYAAINYATVDGDLTALDGRALTRDHIVAEIKGAVAHRRSDELTEVGNYIEAEAHATDVFEGLARQIAEIGNNPAQLRRWALGSHGRHGLHWAI